MSDTATLLDTQVAAFAAAIRRHLDDLPADDVDDLTGGLEADLLEQASDHDGTLTLGDPELYAAELRASAGFPERSAAVPPKRRWRESAADAFARLIGRIRATPGGTWILDFFVSLRPAWWLLRGWAMYQLATIVTGTFTVSPLTAARWPVLVAAVIISVQWGRGKWLPVTWFKPVRTLVSVAAVIALPALLSAALHETSTVVYVDAEPAPSMPDRTGLWVDGSRVSNIFAYDADGKPLTNVQLFNQHGAPLTTVGSEYVDLGYDYFYFYDSNSSTVPYFGAYGGRSWNVFPLDTVKNPDGGEPDLLNAQAAAPPFETVPSLPGMPASSSAPSPAPTTTTDPAIADPAAVDPAGGVPLSAAPRAVVPPVAETQPTP